MVSMIFLLFVACGGHWSVLDGDGDGFTVLQGDCWDSPKALEGQAAASIHPGATEIWYDGVDQNCDGNDTDQDGDGVAFPEDCVDDPTLSEGLFAAEIYPGAEDVPYDGLDADCQQDDDFDADHDGFSAIWSGGTDCYDIASEAFADPAGIGPSQVYPGAEDVPYDGTDANCDGIDDDADHDGFPVDQDCDDLDASRAPDLAEIWYDGLDQNCDGNDGDQDRDGFWSSSYAFALPIGALGGDCADDPNAPPVPAAGYEALPSSAIFPEALDIPYDEIDADCAGDSDQDADGDQSPASVDCDDSDPTIYPSAIEFCNAIDDDCSGLPDDGGSCPCTPIWQGTTPYLSCLSGTGSEADALCAQYGYHAAIITLSDTQNWLLEHGRVGWVGLSDQAVEGVYVWADGQPLGIGFWAPGQPDDPGREDCTLLSAEGWSDEDCSQTSTIICEG